MSPAEIPRFAQDDMSPAEIPRKLAMTVAWRDPSQARDDTSAHLGESAAGPRPNLVGGAERGQLRLGVPADLIALRQPPIDLELGTIEHGEIHQVDVLVAGVDVLDLDAGRHDELSRCVHRQPTAAYQARAYAGLLEHLAHGGVVGQFVVFDVTTRRQPLAKLAVVVQQYVAAVHHEDGYGEMAQRTSVRWRRMRRHCGRAS